MTISTITGKKSGKMKAWAICFWLIIWQLASMRIGQEILLVSPVSVLRCLQTLIMTRLFWHSVFSSLWKIAAGFGIAFSCGVIFAVLASRIRLVRDGIYPLMQTIKSVPVASFIILCLVFIPSRHLSIFISFLMVFPIIYTNTLQGILNTSSELLEMADVFQVSGGKRIRYIYLSEVMPYVMSASSVSLGMCWKAGIAAEVIGMPSGSIGERLYQAKIYLNMPELFAWTVVIVALSVGFERLILILLDRMYRRLERI